MARALSTRRLRQSVGWEAYPPADLIARPGHRRTAQVDASRDWLSEFPQEPPTDNTPAAWVEIEHPRIAAPPHTPYRKFSLRQVSPAQWMPWIQSHRHLARPIAVTLAAVSGALLGTALWLRHDGAESAQVAAAPSVTRDLVQSPPAQALTPPLATVPPAAAPSTVFTTQATAPAVVSKSNARALPARQDARPASRPDRPQPRVTTPAPASRLVPPISRVASPPAPPPSSGRAVTPSSAGVAGLPPSNKPAATPSSSPSTVTTRGSAIDRAALVLPAASSEPETVSSPSTSAAAAAAKPPVPSSPSPEARATAAVEAVLERYRFAFSTLNSGVSDFWPGVNSRALDKAFNELEEQRFDFDQCKVQVTGERANASCTGRATFVPRVGNKTPRTQPRQWTFALVQVSNRWIIDTVQSR